MDTIEIDADMLQRLLTFMAANALSLADIEDMIEALHILPIGDWHNGR